MATSSVLIRPCVCTCAGNFPSLVGPEQLVSRRNTDKGVGTVLGSAEEVPADEEQRTLHFLYQVRL